MDVTKTTKKTYSNYFILVFWEMDVLATGDQACVGREQDNILSRRSNFVFAKYGEGILGFGS